ncbi:MAG: hypothetical protein PHQ42_04490 [Patescibacteria group bacterium]|nr:hypothetical protein [Patescibacteria group bacterium]
MGFERITPAVLGKENDPEKEALIKEYEKNKKEVEKLLAKIHEIEGKLGKAA